MGGKGVTLSEGKFKDKLQTSVNWVVNLLTSVIKLVSTHLIVYFLLFIFLTLKLEN